ncbi:MAG: glycosyltransferase family 2 protein [Betaproteobacteria bacterium]|nr:glycosyltransferase family 2 protein [Betaproteobacteria bacterium]
MINGLVSIITPVYNRPAQLRDAVQSVLIQDYRPIELIIIDDGSSDDTLASALELSSASPGLISVLTQANTGPGPARERGRLAAKGEFIQYLDSDDVLLPGKFSSQVAALKASPESGVAYGMTRFRHADGSLAPGPWKGLGRGPCDDVPGIPSGTVVGYAQPALSRDGLRSGWALDGPAAGGGLGIRLPGRFSWHSTRLVRPICMRSSRPWRRSSWPWFGKRREQNATAGAQP